jgi:hypothetical protein
MSSDWQARAWRCNLPTERLASVTGGGSDSPRQTRSKRGRSVDSRDIQPSFRHFLPPVAGALPLEVAPRLWSWDHAGHPSQTRLTAFLDHAESRLKDAGIPAAPLTLQLNVALGPGTDLFQSGDLDNYLIPIALRLGGDRIVSAWATKSLGGQSSIQVEAAREAGPEAIAGWSSARVRARGSATGSDWKRQVRDQVAAQCVPAPEGPLEMQVGFRVGPGRSWNNLWKQSIDALGPILGLTRPGNEFHPLDGRIVRLGLHHTEAPELGFDVELGIWWRAAEGKAGRAGRHEAVTVSAPRPVRQAPAVTPARREDPHASRSTPDTEASAMAVIVFRNDDEGYIRWIQEHPEGFVVNTTPSFSRSYLKLHRASCKFVSEFQKGYSRWTTGDYIKVCSVDRAALDAWAREKAGGELQAGCYCRA